MNEIKVVDSFLDPSDLHQIIKRTYPISSEWKIQPSSKYVSSHLQEFLKLDVTEEEYFNTTIFGYLKKHLDREYKIESIYFNGQWFGREGTHHIDPCERTALIYINPYEYGWGGFTEIMTSATDPKIIVPLQNRLVIFPGKLKHKGYSFSYQHCPMRITLAYKLL